MDNLISMALKLIYRKARCMDRAPVLGDEVSIRVEELLIIGTSKLTVFRCLNSKRTRSGVDQEYHRVSIPRGRA